MCDCKTNKFNCCTPDDVAETMLSLVLSNRFVTGEIIIDGGFSITT